MAEIRAQRRTVTRPLWSQIAAPIGTDRRGRTIREDALGNQSTGEFFIVLPENWREYIRQRKRVQGMNDDIAADIEERVEAALIARRGMPIAPDLRTRDDKPDQFARNQWALGRELGIDWLAGEIFDILGDFDPKGDNAA